MEEFGRIIRAEGWEYHPDASKQVLGWQYRDMADRLSAVSLMASDLGEAAEYCKLATDYILLAELAESEISLE